jgi:hypothetical protein
VGVKLCCGDPVSLIATAVTVFDAMNGKVLATIDVDDRTEFLAFDGKGMIYDSLFDRLFLPTGDYGPAPPATPENPHPWKPVIPGTFRVLVLDP